MHVLFGLFGGSSHYSFYRESRYQKGKKPWERGWLAKELTTANSLVNDSESEDEAVLFIIMTPVMLDEELNQKYNR